MPLLGNVREEGKGMGRTKPARRWRGQRPRSFACRFAVALVRLCERKIHDATLLLLLSLPPSLPRAGVHEWRPLVRLLFRSSARSPKGTGMRGPVVPASHAYEGARNKKQVEQDDRQLPGCPTNTLHDKNDQCQSPHVGHSPLLFFSGDDFVCRSFSSARSLWASSCVCCRFDFLAASLPSPPPPPARRFVLMVRLACRPPLSFGTSVVDTHHTRAAAGALLCQHFLLFFLRCVCSHVACERDQK